MVPRASLNYLKVQFKQVWINEVWLYLLQEWLSSGNNYVPLALSKRTQIKMPAQEWCKLIGHWPWPKHGFCFGWCRTSALLLAMLLLHWKTLSCSTPLRCQSVHWVLRSWAHLQGAAAQPGIQRNNVWSLMWQLVYAGGEVRWCC